MINNIFTGSEGEIVCDLFEINKDCYFLIKADIDWDLNWDDEINDSFKVFRDDCYDVIKKWLSIIDHAKCKIDIDNNEQLVINLTKTHKWIEQTIYNEL